MSEPANRTREAGNRDEVEGVVTITLNLFCHGAVGFIDWLGLWGTKTLVLAYVASLLSIAIYAPVRLLPIWMAQTDDPKVASPTGVCHAIPAMKNALRPK